MTKEKKEVKVGIYGLVKRFGEVRAVDNISLEVERGEFITLLGPSGSGKTTTLMVIAGFEIQDRGEILIDGKSIMFKPAYKRGIGMVFQNYSLFPHMTVEQNIGFPLRMRKVAKEERSNRIKQALELVRLPNYEKRFPRQLSGGQQQRIALARALVFNPYVLLMDEPLGALDKKLREHMQLEIKQITQSLDITVIYVTHDQSEAMTMSDRIAVMNEGRIEQIGSPKEIYDHPKNYFVADFIGESNFIQGEIRQYHGQTCHFVSKSGVDFKAFSSQDKPVGKEAYLVIRPEKISFVEGGQAFSNHFEVVIDDAAYVGDITVFRVKPVHDDTVLTIRQQNKFINRPIERGDTVTIGWNENDNWVV
jgi:putative spermidine/putrescine transport system ATP-binding protein